MSKRFTRRFLFLRGGNSHSLDGTAIRMNATFSDLSMANPKWRNLFKNKSKKGLTHSQDLSEYERSTKPTKNQKPNEKQYILSKKAQENKWGHR